MSAPASAYLLLNDNLARRVTAGNKQTIVSMALGVALAQRLSKPTGEIVAKSYYANNHHHYVISVLGEMLEKVHCLNADLAGETCYQFWQAFHEASIPKNYASVSTLDHGAILCLFSADRYISPEVLKVFKEYGEAMLGVINAFHGFLEELKEPVVPV